MQINKSLGPSKIFENPEPVNRLEEEEMKISKSNNSTPNDTPSNSSTNLPPVDDASQQGQPPLRNSISSNSGATPGSGKATTADLNILVFLLEKARSISDRNGKRIVQLQTRTNDKIRLHKDVIEALRFLIEAEDACHKENEKIINSSFLNLEQSDLQKQWKIFQNNFFIIDCKKTKLIAVPISLCNLCLIIFYCLNLSILALVARSSKSSQDHSREISRKLKAFWEQQASALRQ